MKQYAIYILFYCNITLHVSGAIDTHIRSTQNCSYSLWYKSYVRAATSLQRGQVRRPNLPHEHVTCTSGCNYSFMYS